MTKDCFEIGERRKKRKERSLPSCDNGAFNFFFFCFFSLLLPLSLNQNLKHDSPIQLHHFSPAFNELLLKYLCHLLWDEFLRRWFFVTAREKEKRRNWRKSKLSAILNTKNKFERKSGLKISPRENFHKRKINLRHLKALNDPRDVSLFCEPTISFVYISVDSPANYIDHERFFSVEKSFIYSFIHSPKLSFFNFNASLYFQNRKCVFNNLSIWNSLSMFFEWLLYTYQAFRHSWERMHVCASSVQNINKHYGLMHKLEIGKNNMHNIFRLSPGLLWVGGGSEHQAGCKNCVCTCNIMMLIQ